MSLKTRLISVVGGPLSAKEVAPSGCKIRILHVKEFFSKVVLTTTILVVIIGAIQPVELSFSNGVAVEAMLFFSKLNVIFSGYFDPEKIFFDDENLTSISTKKEALRGSVRSLL